MVTRSKFFALFLILHSVLPADGSAAQKHVFYFGGGGEPDGDETLFDAAAERFGRFFSSNGWKSRVLFDGEHRRSQAAVKNGFGIDAQPFTKSNFEKELAQIRKELTDGNFHKGDQFLIVINSHGAPKEADERSHSVAAGSNLVSLDALSGISAALEKRGVKVAIIDSSCYSGNSLKLATPNRCVITASAPESVGNQSTTSLLSRALTRGRPLEELFLETRSEETEFVSPEISTPAGITTSQELQALRRTINPVINEMEGIPDVGSSGACARTDPFADLTAFLRQMNRIGKANRALEPSVDELAATFRYYRQQVQDAKRLIKEISAFDSQRVDIELRVSDRAWAMNYRWESLALTTAQHFAETLVSTDERYQSLSEREKTKRVKDLTRQLEKTYAELEKDPAFRQLRAKTRECSALKSSIAAQAIRYNQLERKIYQELYRKHSAGSKPNPCKEFTL